MNASINLLGSYSTNMRYFATAVFFLFFSLTQVSAEPLLKPGDRVTFLGGTFVERMQIHGHFEAEIRSRLEGDIRFRNLGWAGDNVRGESRAVFGTVENGMERLLRDMALTNPTVIIIFYGGNEAHSGIAGIKQFKNNLETLTNNLDRFSTRYIFVGPRPYENLGPPLPAPNAYNTKLRHYSNAIEEHAAEKDSPFINLAALKPHATNDLITNRDSQGLWILTDAQGLTSNGVHLTSTGYRQLASSFADALKLPLKKIRLTTDGTSTGVSGVTVDRVNQTFTIRATSNQMPLPGLTQSGKSAGQSAILAIPDLPSKRYLITSAGINLGIYNRDDLAQGVKIQLPVNAKQITELHDAIITKNMMFFHRHRPQNETYLFLFRKHEQGNNAAEVPKFDAIVDDYDRRVYELSRPQPFTISIKPAK